MILEASPPHGEGYRVKVCGSAGFSWVFAGLRRSPGVVTPALARAGSSWRSPDWPARTGYGAARCSCSGRDRQLLMAEKWSPDLGPGR